MTRRPGDVGTTVVLSSALWEAVKFEAIRRHTTYAQLMREAVKAYLNIDDEGRPTHPKVSKKTKEEK